MVSVDALTEDEAFKAAVVEEMSWVAADEGLVSFPPRGFLITQVIPEEMKALVKAITKLISTSKSCPYSPLLSLTRTLPGDPQREVHHQAVTHLHVSPLTLNLTHPHRHSPSPTRSSVRR